MRYVSVNVNSVLYCKREGCDKYSGKTGSRGLCEAHYMQLYRQVKRGQATWEELEAQGLCDPIYNKNSKNAGCVRCGREVRTRGLCEACYQDALRKVNKNQTSWEELEQTGLATPRVWRDYAESSLTWEDREFLTTVNYQQSLDKFPPELFQRAVSHGWIEQEDGQWWLSNLGAKEIEQFNRILFADTDYPLS